MRNIIILIGIILSFSSCSRDDDAITQENSILGKWKLLEKMEAGTDGLPVWKAVDEAETYTYTFLRDETVINSANNCIGGYNLNKLNSIVNIKYDCATIEAEGSFEFTVKDNNLILSPTPNPCDEGCALKFIKVRG